MTSTSWVVPGTARTGPPIPRPVWGCSASIRLLQPAHFGREPAQALMSGEQLFGRGQAIGSQGGHRRLPPLPVAVGPGAQPNEVAQDRRQPGSQRGALSRGRGQCGSPGLLDRIFAVGPAPTRLTARRRSQAACARRSWGKSAKLGGPGAI